MRKAAALAGLVMLTVAGTVEGTGSTPFFSVVPFEFDPYGSHLVAGMWKEGIGCPSNAWVTPDGVVFNTYTDPACTSGDPKDKGHQGLLLAKTGPTANFASAGATLQGVKGIMLTELGYDVRKQGLFAGPLGSHCNNGSPRFNVTTADDVTHFVGCAFPPPMQTATGNGWIRLRWTTAELLLATILPTDVVKSISIVFDEGQDTGPDFFGLAVLDNIDVNTKLVGRGPNKPHDNDRDDCQGKDKDNRHFSGHSSASRPEESDLSFADPTQGVRIQMINGARSVSYTGACVSFIGDALMNDDPGHVVSFTACDLSALSTPLTPSIGSYTIAVTGASGVVYQKAGALTAGKISIHPR
jgi:hypothetical protein